MRPSFSQTSRSLNGQTIAQLAGEHDNLTAMMAFMRDEIRQDMPHVEGKITPDVRPGVGDRAASVKTKRQQTDHAAATVA